MTFGSFGATAIAPTDEISGAPPFTLKSVMLVQLWPALMVFHTPPLAEPK